MPGAVSVTMLVAALVGLTLATVVDRANSINSTLSRVGVALPFSPSYTSGVVKLLWRCAGEAP